MDFNNLYHSQLLTLPSTSIRNNATKDQVLMELSQILELTKKEYMLGLCMIGGKDTQEEHVVDQSIKERYFYLQEQHGNRFMESSLNSYIYGIQLAHYNHSFINIYEGIYFTLLAVKEELEELGEIEVKILQSTTVEEFIKKNYDVIHQKRRIKIAKVKKKEEIMVALHRDLKDEIKSYGTTAPLIRMYVNNCLLDHQALCLPELDEKELPYFKATRKEKFIIRVRLEKMQKEAFSYLCKKKGVHMSRIIEQYLIQYCSSNLSTVDI